ncbi:hypothetical protein STVA_36000 [Allostella vacuolata]|nr:hypothetical protein STVA_36000 [Stella vacuolata]
MDDPVRDRLVMSDVASPLRENPVGLSRHGSEAGQGARVVPGLPVKEALRFPLPSPGGRSGR